MKREAKIVFSFLVVLCELGDLGGRTGFVFSASRFLRDSTD